MQIVKNDDFEDENNSGQCLTNIYIKKLVIILKKLIIITILNQKRVDHL